MNILPALLKDGYKVGHKFQYPKGTNLVYSNITPRASRIAGTDKVVAFGFQYFVMEYLLDQFRENFFAEDRDDVVRRYKRRIDNYLGPGIDVSHIGELHELGYLPLLVKAVPEGTLVPLRVPMLTIRNTDDKFFWLTNMLETLMANVTWMPITSATIAHEYKKAFLRYAKETGSDVSFCDWQGHDFSMRGMSGIEAACLSGAAHLLSFTGTDTIPAIDFLEQYYGANSDNELVGGSVPATEHSVMCLGREEAEFDTFRRLITEVYPKGIVSVVSDSWDFWRVLTDYLPRLRSEIMARDGKLVIRPDSGDPTRIIVGDDAAVDKDSPEAKGAIQLLWETFGGTTTSTGHRVLDPHIGLIYGDSINRERQEAILGGLAAKGFASGNVVLGIGSYTYQFNTRDTFGQAMKATYGEIDHRPYAIFKKPKTDSGLKNSAKGLLSVGNIVVNGGARQLELLEECTWEQEERGLLQPIFQNGKQHNFQSLARIRARLASYL